MEQAIGQTNLRKYHQTEGASIFHNENMKEQFGQYGKGYATDKVLDSTYEDLQKIDEYTSEFLKVCARTETDVLENYHQTATVFKNSWMKMNEKTSSNKDLHFGHYKAGVQSKANLIAHYVLAEIPFRTGYTLQRWKTATNIMLLKSSRVYDVNKLRTIVLYKADFNHNNKHFGRSFMKQVVTNGRLAKEQYSAPGRKCIDHAVNRRLIFDISQYQKTSLAMTSCNLKSCYDRVVHTAAVLSLLGYGAPREPLFSMFYAIQHMRYTTRTVFGDSKDSVGGMEGFMSMPQGLGQGNGAAPPNWSGISSKMFKVLHKKNYRTSFLTPISYKEEKLCGLAYVDDTDMLVAIPETNDPEKTVERMQ